MYGQTVQTHIRLSLEKQSNQGLHCLQFCQYLYLVLFYKNLLVQFLAYLQQSLGSHKILEYYNRHFSKLWT